MKIQTVKFPATPDETLEVVTQLRPFIDKSFAESDGSDSTSLPNEMLVMMWHAASLDFIELLDDNGKRVGVIMNQLIFHEGKGERFVKLMAAYIEPEYRGKGEFKRMVDYMKVVYQARNVDYIDVVVLTGQPFTLEGKEVAKVIRMEL